MKKNTPMMKLIEWIDTMEFTYYPIKDIHAKATELLAEEREFAFENFVAGSERGTNNIPFNCEQYFTQTYGGGDE